MDERAHARHEKRLKETKLIQLGEQYTAERFAAELARNEHPPHGSHELFLKFTQVANCFVFRCSCGEEVDVTAFEAMTSL